MSQFVLENYFPRSSFRFRSSIVIVLELVLVLGFSCRSENIKDRELLSRPANPHLASPEV